MWPPIAQINLLRYLVVWRVNGAFVQLPRCLPAEISRVLGTLIAERLPTQQAKPWRKMLGAWGQSPDVPPATQAGDGSAGTPGGKKPADRLLAARQVRSAAPTPGTFPPWPIESVIWTYPGKRAYGQDEPILWELKLLGDAADHGLFLEMILPVMEAAATTSDERWHQPRTLWGRFDIQSIQVARGVRWEPVVTDGRLDLACRPDPAQWAEGLSFEPDAKHLYHRLTWLTPFDLPSRVSASSPEDVAESPAAANGVTGEAALDEAAPDDASQPAALSETSRSALLSQSQDSLSRAPALSDVLDALMARTGTLVFGKWATSEQAWAQLGAEERLSVRKDCAEGSLRRHSLEAPLREWPGRWIGTQHFAKIPHRLVPYLHLASIVHIGQHPHFGCGTFMLE